MKANSRRRPKAVSKSRAGRSGRRRLPSWKVGKKGYVLRDSQKYPHHD